MSEREGFVGPLDPTVRAALALSARPGGYAVLLGAGISRSTGIPSAWDVLEDLIGLIAEAQGQHRPDDPARWWEDQVGSPPDYSQVLESVAATPGERRALLEPYFSRTAEDPDDVKSPSAAHHAVADLMAHGLVRIAITTNFDLLLENAIRARGLDPQVVSTPTAFARLEPLHALRCTVLHLNGDYLHPDVLNTKSELESYPPDVAAVIRQVFNEYGLIAAGWSAKWDRGLVDLLWGASPARYGSWWIEPEDLNPEQLALLQARSGEHIARSGDDALPEIAQMTAVIQEAEHRTHPLEMAAATRLARSELAAGGRALRTHDRLRASLESLSECKSIRATSFDGDADERMRREQVLLDAAALPLGLVAALAYWGDERTDGWWFDSIERLAFRPHVSGTSSLIGLSRAASHLMMYAAGVAACAANRWTLVGRLLAEPSAELSTGSDARPVALALSPSDLGLSAGVSTIYSLLWDIFRDGLGFDTGSFVDAWERFEYLHHIHWVAASTAEGGGGRLGWPPNLRIEGLGPRAGVPTPDIWLERALRGLSADAEFAGLTVQQIQAARRVFGAGFAAYASDRDTQLLTSRVGFLPSGRHYPGRYDDDPRPVAR